MKRIGRIIPNAPTLFPYRAEGADGGALLEHTIQFLMPIVVEMALDQNSRAAD